MLNFYVYYSYEEWGRGYIGSRGCECLPEEDIKYFGSFGDKSFSPTEKIIIGVFASREEAIECEILLHEYFEVNKNPHFVNKSKQTSSKFQYDCSGEFWVTDGVQEKKLKEGSEIPGGYREGRLLEFKEWYTNGVTDLWLKVSDTVPDGYSKGRSIMQGDNNPTSGKKWINNGEINKLHDPETSISEGWVEGMIQDRQKRFWINNGLETKQHLSLDPIPSGWEKGRLMPWASDAGKSKGRR